MQDCGGVVKGEAKPVDGVVTAGGKLRHQIFNKITPILLESNEIKDSNVRLLIQAMSWSLKTRRLRLLAAFQTGSPGRWGWLNWRLWVGR